MYTYFYLVQTTHFYNQIGAEECFGFLTNNATWILFYFFYIHAINIHSKPQNTNLHFKYYKFIIPWLLTVLEDQSLPQSTPGLTDTCPQIEVKDHLTI